MFYQSHFLKWHFLSPFSRTEIQKAKFNSSARLLVPLKSTNTSFLKACDKPMAQHRDEPEGDGIARITSTSKAKLLRSAATLSLLSSTPVSRASGLLHLFPFVYLSFFFIPTEVQTLQRKKHHFNSSTVAFSLLKENRTQEQGRSLRQKDFPVSTVEVNQKYVSF